MRNITKDVDIIYHLAAEARIQPALKNPLLAVKTNVQGTTNILQCARENEVKRIVYSSTSSAYGRKNKLPLSEDMPNDCLNPYSVTKTAGEEMCKMYTNLFNLETVTLRYFNVYGDRQPLRGQYAPVVGLFLRQKNDGEPMTIVGDGEQRRDFTHIDDIVEANIRAGDLENQDVVGETINVGTGSNWSINDIAEMIGGETKSIANRPGEARETLASTDKLKRLLNMNPVSKLESYILDNL
jgi:UDP-glucose 4-epimerase